jgi:hypothetical protein
LTTDVYSIESWRSKKKSSSRYQNARKDTIGTKMLRKTAAQGLGFRVQCRRIKLVKNNTLSMLLLLLMGVGLYNCCTSFSPHCDAIHGGGCSSILEDKSTWSLRRNVHRI